MKGLFAFKSGLCSISFWGFNRGKWLFMFGVIERSNRGGGA